MAHPDANKPVPARLANQGFVRDPDTGQLVRTDAARQDAIRSGGLASRPVHRPAPLNISHEQLIEAAVAELNGKETLLGFWDFIRNLSATARANPEKYSGEMARPEKWTKGFVERWLSQNILEIWRRAHILGDQLDVEEWKDRFWSKRDNFAEVGPRRSGKPIHTGLKKRKPRLVKTKVTRRDRVRGAAVRAKRKAGPAVSKVRGTISTIATKARAGAGAAWKRKRGLTQGARRIATRRFADAMNEWNYVAKDEEKKTSKKRRAAGIAGGLLGGAATIGGAALLRKGVGRGLKGKVPKRQGTARGSRLRRRTESRKKSIHGSGKGPGMNYLKKRSYLSEESDQLHEYFLGIAGSLAAGAVGSAIGGMAGKKKKKKNGQAIPY